MSGAIMYGKCEICGKETNLERTYFEYDFKCDCHSPNHFEMVEHCKDCVPVPPKRTTVTVKPRFDYRKATKEELKKFNDTQLTKLNLINRMADVCEMNNSNLPRNVFIMDLEELRKCWLGLYDEFYGKEHRKETIEYIKECSRELGLKYPEGMEKMSYDELDLEASNLADLLDK